MTRIEESVDIGAPPARVWTVLNDLERLGEWVEEHRGFPEGAPDELRAGVSYTQRVRAAGQDVDIAWTVVEHDEPRRLAFDGSGPAGATATLRYELEPLGDDGTRMGYATSFELPGGALGGIVGRAAAPGEDEARGTLERLKRLAEAG